MTNPSTRRPIPPNSGPSDTSDSGSRVTWVVGTIACIAVFGLLIHVLKLLTAAVATANREQLFGGAAGFLSTMLIAGAGVVGATILLKGGVAVFSTTVSQAFKKVRLRKAKRHAENSIERKQELLEERIRLTAQLKATWMFEREAFQLADSHARREFQAALQTSVTRSCEIAFDQIGRVIEQYEQVLEEIGNSRLDASDKKDLIDQLTQQLNLSATEQKTLSAERLMEDQIWKMRIATANRLQQKNDAAALRYLQDVESGTVPCPGRRKVQAMIRRLQRRLPG